jgi:LmbE family N-acetylglucosaminyl deacetylase
MLALSKNLKVLAVGAHPDDIELSCGGTLLKLKKEYDACIYTLIFSKGELKSNPLIRAKEQARAGKFLGVFKSRLLNYKDGSILVDSNLVNEIEQLVKEYQPDLIFTHCIDDIHQDHRNIGWATLSATRRKKPAILLYSSLFTRDRFTPNLYIDISKHLDQKLKLLSLFKSQESNEYMDPEVIKAQARESGLHSGCKYAEEFYLNFWIF